ncbi:hypothetical protein EVAR_101949_1 [Eumeta japonica]|uniref:Uncharacterized protein n=1 Tax=Eumeta variegata TaxID=151549 RepID=A0A4C1TSX9_EUMVA|nr:hypothetical protein EVAR_101949_1 [Eumeta japonica]
MTFKSDSSSMPVRNRNLERDRDQNRERTWDRFIKKNICDIKCLFHARILIPKRYKNTDKKSETRPTSGTLLMTSSNDMKDESIRCTSPLPETRGDRSMGMIKGLMSTRAQPLAKASVTYAPRAVVGERADKPIGASDRKLKHARPQNELLILSKRGVYLRGEKHLHPPKRVCRLCPINTPNGRDHRSLSLKLLFVVHGSLYDGIRNSLLIETKG